jgi:hypothetical protein
MAVDNEGLYGKDHEAAAKVAGIIIYHNINKTTSPLHLKISSRIEGTSTLLQFQG